MKYIMTASFFMLFAAAPATALTQRLRPGSRSRLSDVYHTALHRPPSAQLAALFQLEGAQEASFSTSPGNISSQLVVDRPELRALSHFPVRFAERMPTTEIHLTDLFPQYALSFQSWSGASIPKFRLALEGSNLLNHVWNYTGIKFMATPAFVSRLTSIIALSLVSACCLGTSSCTSQSEKDFAAQHGYKRSDYFGSYHNKNHVPADARKYN